MTQRVPGWRIEVVHAVAWTTAVAIPIAALLIRFPPERYDFYPRCPIASYLHVQCPGCGATRALAALLQGHLTDAFRLNSLITLLLPIAVAYYAWHLWQQRNFSRISFPQPTASLIHVMLAIAVLFTVARNLITT